MFDDGLDWFEELKNEKSSFLFKLELGGSCHGRGLLDHAKGTYTEAAEKHSSQEATGRPFFP